MKGIRFYEELTDKGHKGEQSKHNVIAIDTVTGAWKGVHGCYYYNAAASVFPIPNSGVCQCMIPVDHLCNTTRRISESRAREIHPRLFEYLEQSSEAGE